MEVNNFDCLLITAMNNVYHPLDLFYQIKWPEHVTLATEGDASLRLFVSSIVKEENDRFPV